MDAAPDRLRTNGEQHRNGGGRTSGGNDPRGRVVGRRRALPSGRAVVGGLLMGAAALVVFAAVMAGAGSGTARNYAVAARSLPAGSLIEPGDLSTRSMRLPSSVATSAFPDAARLVGRAIAVPVAGGELIESSMLTEPEGTAGLRPVTVSVDQAGLGSLAPGQPVDVLDATGGQGAPGVSVVMRGATLLSVSRPGSGLLSNPAPGLATLGVSSLDEVEALIAASHSGTLTLVAAEPSDGVGPGPGVGGAAGGSSG